jgi:hypothetical protein
VRAVRPGASRDYDIFFSSVALLVGGILCFQGWRLDPILLFGQILTITAAIAFGVEAIQLRKESDSRSDRPPWDTSDWRDDRRSGGGRNSYELPSSRRPTVGEWEQQQWEQAPPRRPAQWNAQAQRWEEEPLSSWEDAQWEEVETDPYSESGAFQQAYEQGRRGNNSSPPSSRATPPPPPPPPPEEARYAPDGRRSSTAETLPRPQPPSWQVDDWE